MSWQAYFNLNRKNSSQGWVAPVERRRTFQDAFGLPPVDPGILLPRSSGRRQDSRTQETIHHLTEPAPHDRANMNPDSPVVSSSAKVSPLRLKHRPQRLH